MRIAALVLLALATGPPRLVPFEKDDRWGYRTNRGEVVIEPRYQMAQPFSSAGIAAVLDQEGGWSYIDRTGRLVITPFVFDNGPDYFRQGLARFTADGKFGFFDQRGTVVIKPQFDFANPFAEGRAAVCRDCRAVKSGEHSSMEGGTWGFIDRTGNLVIPLRFEAAQDFANGAARVKFAGAWQQIDKAGRSLRK